ncbi:MAG: glycosyltransferase family 4 protein [Bdellovibrionales bacterium]
MTFLLPLLLSFAIAWPLTALIRRRLLAKAVMDVPNERSMHKIPVPRGGGLAVMLVVLGGLLLLEIRFQTPSLLLLSFAILLLMAVSWIDDKKQVSPAVRLPCHLLAAGIGSLALGDHAMLFAGFLPFWLDRALMILGWGWFMNLYNFMDGIDGLTGVQTVCCAFGAGLLLVLSGNPETPALLPLCALIIGACWGFLMLNWHPARLFLGDVGSVPLGFLIGFLLLKLATTGPAFLLPALLLPLYYLADSGITITRRALKGEKIWQAHRQHFYQRATAGEGSPVPVLLWIATGNMGLLACAVMALNAPWLGGLLGVGILLLLLIKLTHSAMKEPRA